MQVSRQYHFEFEHPVDKLWAIVSDTPRWGEALGSPRYQASERLLPDGTVEISGQVELAGFQVEWIEPPVNWIAERWFEQRRVFKRGPMREMTTSATLHDHGATSALDLELVFDTRNPLGTLLAKFMVNAYENKARGLLESASRLIRAEQPELFESAYEAPREALQRAEALLDRIRQSPYEHGLGDRLLAYINDNQEVDLWAMRPLEIAHRWGADARKTVELFLQSVREGLLESRWDILCPRCRVSQSASANISDLPRGVHCDACNIDFESDFAGNVELSFSPSPSIRHIENGFFCRSGPGVTPHVKGQCSLPPGESRRLPLVLHPGNYRLRTLEAGGEAELEWQGGEFPEIRVDGDAVDLNAVSPEGEIRMVNAGSLPRTVVIEDTSWLSDVLTADRATTLQAFRDLFSDQVLRPGDEVSVRNIVFLFSDLVGSSDLFTRVGDAEAYRIVREHFAELGDIVRRHRGNIVKTVGDGIHAAFLAPDDALRAAIEMQRGMPDFNRRLDCGGISIRIGLHAGASIAVTLNDRLDYYGEAVNLAARLEGLGEAGDITMSRAFGQDPAVDDILHEFDSRDREIELKGFAQPVVIRHINPLAIHDKTVD